jgi:DNA-3-methyladenine glycosylase I
MVFTVRPIVDADRPWVAEFIEARWSVSVVAVHGVLYRPAELEGFVAESAGEVVGLATFRVVGAACEVVTLDSLREGGGVGAALLEAVRSAAQQARCERVWLITTNDNLHALGFYQKRGFELAAVHRGAVAQARRLKPEIPAVGESGIPIRDEIELELPLRAER